MDRAAQRRRFLKYLAASPLLAAGVPDWLAGFIDDAEAQDRLPKSAVITSPNDALNVFDFEAAARQTLPPAHFGYLATGVDDDATLAANREGFKRFQLRPRRMVDVSHADLRTELFGAVWDHPISLAPVGSQRAFHPEGELAVARGARAMRALQILSTVTTCSVEEVNQAAGRPVWFQLYPTSRWE